MIHPAFRVFSTRLAKASALSVLLALSVSSNALAATRDALWLAWFNTSALSDDLSVIADFQIRSTDDARSIQNVLARIGMQGKLSDSVSLAGGYAHIGTHNLPGRALHEHRPWQQVSFGHDLESGRMTHRLRLEQRFTEMADVSGRTFSQRFRYFNRTVFPIGDSGPSATQKPLHVALQHELFFNIQHADALNGRRFDQNRAYVAFGYRKDPRYDLEVGYLNQRVLGRTSAITNHVLQVAIYTRF